jgi:Mg-chelatase subunit ChlD
VVAFNDGAVRMSGLTADRSALDAALSGLTTAPGTRIERGRAAAAAVLAETGDPAAQPVVILLTDGLQSGPIEPVVARAGALRADGAIVFAIGLGGDADMALLRRLVADAGDALASPTAAGLDEAYRRIASRLACRVR